MELRIALIGFGVVGQGFVRILAQQEDSLKEQGLDVKLVAVSDIQKGSVYNPEGLVLDTLLNLILEEKSIKGYPNGMKDLDGEKTISESNADLIVEASWSNLETGEPALTYAKKALELQKHVVLTNKGPPVLALAELKELARMNSVELRYEGTVLSGTPAINLGQLNLAQSGLRGFKGILNGTTNYILTLMEEGQDYASALKLAQEEGYAEADPTADVEGHDALGKVVILANSLLNVNITTSEVHCEGISGMTMDDIESAQKEGKRWKLIASAERNEDGTISASVRPQKLLLSHPLASVMGPTNSITFSTEYLGDVTITGPGAGMLPTGYAIFNDVLDIIRVRKS
ncbi:MAG: homoserine dehydrogenase [Candidatus Thorarchaeota archaeon]|jgi:homoserine dehydrogenase